ncbi:unnamed protein product [Spirodela intermedia]|uniref:Uncharacterized protein n=1 Tax=Spirodela intermedia TaxID=51605 RepID=A0A7I8IL60_SPIIN|nr:unnamed protein product [Spirodela intermedia]CAA6658267.1 unnamed protein product [Spirodela intermedia]
MKILQLTTVFQTRNKNKNIAKWGTCAGESGPQAGWKCSRGVAASRDSSGLNRWGHTCAPLPFHVTGGQPAVGIVVQCPRPQRLSLDKDDVGNL